MANLNQCNFIGNAGGAPTVKSFDNGDKIAQVNIACTERFKGRDGQPQERTEWVPLLFSGPLADIAERFIDKGTQVYVSAKYTRREYTNAEGVKKQLVEFRVRELQLLSGRKEAEAAAPAADPAPAPAPAHQADEPDLPF